MLSQGKNVRKKLDENEVVIMMLNPYSCLGHITV